MHEFSRVTFVTIRVFVANKNNPLAVDAWIFRIRFVPIRGLVANKK
jgi:hypothetical protein